MNNRPALTQHSQTEWHYNGTHTKALIKHERVGLIKRFVVPGTKTRPFRHFHTVYEAANWLAKQERSNQGSNSNARRNI